MLESIGVSPDDEAVYRALLARSEAEPVELAGSLDRGPSSVQAALSRLEDLGLVHRMPGTPLRMRAARPDVAIEVVVGREAIAARFEQVLTSTRDELLVLDRPPYVSDAQASDSSVRSLLREAVTVRGIYAPEALELPGALEAAQDAARAGELSRVHADVPMKLAIGDRNVAILPVGASEAVDAALCIRPSALLDALVQHFDLLWDQATPIIAPEDDVAAGDRQLAALLASGAKDEVIARHFGTSTRTLSRRVSELMHRLHVRTRFQAGVQAVRLGWLPEDEPVNEPSAPDVPRPNDRLVE